MLSQPPKTHAKASSNTYVHGIWLYFARNGCTNTHTHTHTNTHIHTQKHICQKILSSSIINCLWINLGITAIIVKPATLAVDDLGSNEATFHLTWSTGPMEWSTGNSYQAEALTNVLRYHTCRSSLPDNRKLPITELKLDARTVTDIPDNNAYWFFAIFWLTKGSRNKKLNIYIKQRPMSTYLLRYLVIRAAMGTGRGWKHR